MSGEWEDYESEFMFGVDPECSCEHDATQHGYSSCDVGGCQCVAHWEHS
jgi:hypothetical protein